MAYHNQAMELPNGNRYATRAGEKKSEHTSESPMHKYGSKGELRILKIRSVLERPSLCVECRQSIVLATSLVGQSEEPEGGVAVAETMIVGSKGVCEAILPQCPPCLNGRWIEPFQERDFLHCLCRLFSLQGHRFE
ncbi:uncharacterized protein VTP21DRAFT_8944 [Calcarisporiella thermophila]|uniref:uncharacterized protein n=1 Tax=Calcarisporiella thermophila TaxID=911321 RepID=UPI003741ECE0